MKYILIMTFVISSAWAGTIIPFERDVARVHDYAYITSNGSESNFFRSEFGADQNDTLYFRGQSVLNTGPNDIIPTSPESWDYPNREYFFITDDHAKRDTYLWITDYIGSGSTGDYFETVIVFLPRVSQQLMKETEKEIHTVLATGEEVVFFKKYKTLISGVLTERPLDFNPDRNERKHVQIDYSGKGIMIRSDSRGSDPRLTKNVKVMKQGLADCILPGSDFWTQEGFPKFKFETDQEAFDWIKAKCGEEYLPNL